MLQSIRLGATGNSACPQCGNSLENRSPADCSELLRCANCKVIFKPIAKDQKHLFQPRKINR